MIDDDEDDEEDALEIGIEDAEELEADVENPDPGVPKSANDTESNPLDAVADLQFDAMFPGARRSTRSMLALAEEVLIPAKGLPMPSSTSSRRTFRSSYSLRSNFVFGTLMEVDVEKGFARSRDCASG